MSNIKPISNLKNYTEVLQDIMVGEPVFLAENGENRYVIVDIEDYEQAKAVLKLIDVLFKGEQSIKNKGWADFSEIERMLDIVNN